MPSVKATFTAASLAALGATAALTAGPLTPPAGTVASTYKTLSDIEPRIAVQSLAGSASTLYRITQPGSYYLTGSIAGVTGKAAIQISSSNVTLDLAGFNVTGIPGATYGILVDANTSSVAVRNGRVSGWPQNGIEAGNSSNSAFENLQLVGGAKSGLSAGWFPVVSRCQANSNGEWGLFANDRARFVDCTSNDNGRSGIRAGTAASITGCASAFNDEHGFDVNANSTLTNCSADHNTMAGFRLYDQTTAIGCTATTNTADGFYAEDGLTLSSCVAGQNQANGFRLNGVGGSLTGCTARLNGLDGISALNTYLITNCNADSNGFATTTGAGIHLLGNANRVDGCGLNGNDIGLVADGGGNLVVRSSFTFNPVRVQAAAGNNVAQMLVTPGADFNAVNPWANIAH